MNQLRLLLRAKQLVRHPPSAWKIRLFAVVIGASLLIAGIEYLVGWPAWLTVNSGRLNP